MNPKDFDAWREELGLPYGSPILEEINKAASDEEYHALHAKLAAIEERCTSLGVSMPCAVIAAQSSGGSCWDGSSWLVLAASYV